jgi:hypothetical protein
MPWQQWNDKSGYEHVFRSKGVRKAVFFGSGKYGELAERYFRAINPMVYSNIKFESAMDIDQAITSYIDDVSTQALHDLVFKLSDDPQTCIRFCRGCLQSRRA